MQTRWRILPGQIPVHVDEGFAGIVRREAVRAPLPFAMATNGTGGVDVIAPMISSYSLSSAVRSSTAR
jgi:hypothetical protein